MTAAERKRRVREMLERVELPEEVPESEAIGAFRRTAAAGVHRRGPDPAAPLPHC